MASLQTNFPANCYLKKENMNWIDLTTAAQIENLTTTSAKTPAIIFKHSNKCNTSHMAKYNLEADWDFEATEVDTYLLDLFAQPKLAKLVADKFMVHHQSPQILLIRNGECTYDADHLDISVAELRECFED